MNTVRTIFGVALLAIALMLSACGSDPTPIPQPQPAPPPANPNGGGQFFGGNCGAPGGTFPLSQQPYFGSLQSYHFNSVSSNSISLNLAYYGNYQAGGYSDTIVGGGTLSWPDLVYINQAQAQGFPQQGQFPYSFCVSSTDPVSGQILPGVFVSADNSIAMVLKGFAQVPVYNWNPYSPYPGGGQGNLQYQTTQQEVEVSVGYDQNCGAVLYDGRIYGCMSIRIGNQTYWYQTQ